MGGGYLDQRFQLSDPLLDFVLNKGFRVLLGADCCSQVGLTFVGDVHTGTRETRLGGGQMMFFGNEPCLGCIVKGLSALYTCTAQLTHSHHTLSCLVPMAHTVHFLIGMSTIIEWLANYRTPPTGHLSFLAPRSVINAKFVMEIQVT